MKKFILTALLPLAACGHDVTATGFECATGTTEVDGICTPDVTCGAGTTAMDGMCIPDANGGFHQIEHLARPGINEVFLFSNDFMAGYNATAPTFTGVDSATLGLVVGEAKTVLKALYLGACLLDGVIPDGAGGTLGAAGGVKPAGAQCAEVGGAIFTENNPLTGVTLTQVTKDAAQAYADRVFAQFIPDVMRIDTGAVGNRPAGYLDVCGDPTQPKPLLCGGRQLRDDVIDITYDYLLNGAATCSTGIGKIPGNLCGAPNQVNALVSDGVTFDQKSTNVTAATSAGTTATYNAIGHGFVVGEKVTINGSSVAAYDGQVVVLTAAANSFTATKGNNLAASTGGTVTSNFQSRINGDVNNSQQGHNNVSTIFPYSAPPF